MPRSLANSTNYIDLGVDHATARAHTEFQPVYTINYTDIALNYEVARPDVVALAQLKTILLTSTNFFTNFYVTRSCVKQYYYLLTNLDYLND